MAIANDAVQAAQSAGLTPEVQMLLTIVALVIMIMLPTLYITRDLKKRDRKDSTENSQDKVETDLYKHLAEQVMILTTRLDTVHAQYNKMVERNAVLDARVLVLENCEATAQRLQIKLDEKDVTIAARDAQINEMFNQIRERDVTIFNLQERLHTLELRLARDERDWNNGKDDLK